MARFDGSLKNLPDWVNFSLKLCSCNKTYAIKREKQVSFQGFFAANVQLKKLWLVLKKVRWKESVLLSHERSEYKTPIFIFLRWNYTQKKWRNRMTWEHNEITQKGVKRGKVISTPKGCSLNANLLVQLVFTFTLKERAFLNLHTVQTDGFIKISTCLF